MPELSKTYNPQETEQKIYQRWEESGYFNPDKLPHAKKRKPFVISMPPSNITGDLHIGHALGMTIQDILVRYHRMCGRAALWLPGTDHAAIATQVLVERQLKSEGLTRQQLGREKFLERVWQWKEKHGSNINQQTRRLGASADWSRERFTMDDGLSKAVQEAFIRLHRDGLIYRGTRIINWCPDCQTAISDLEVEHEEVPGKLWFLRYPLADGSGHITVATTRPETMLGDTAVAVHPDDKRYASYVGQQVRLPLTGRLIPIIADKRIEREFGTGAVKVTPAHDPLDFEIGQEHNLETVAVIGFSGRMSAGVGAGVDGMTIDDARQHIVDQLIAGGLLERTEDRPHAIGRCSRSQTVIEPLVSRQWFIKMKPLAVAAMAAVRDGQTKIIPKRFEKVYFQWLENIRDWNISRQIWWGHRMPVWYHREDAGHDQPRVSLKSPGQDWVQDDDTLDTWFSSGLWTFSTLGWPDKTADLKRFHPTDVLETGWDIIFFWVARMMMLSLYFLGQVPFRAVYLHGLILDRQGKKMSRSKQNGIDPVAMIDRYGADALRLSLIIGNAPGQDFRLYEQKIEGYRNFANKLWNVSRYVLAKPRPRGSGRAKTLADRWILERLARCRSVVTTSTAGYDLAAAGQSLYDFLWHDFADWYIEASKVEINIGLLYRVLETYLQLLHPYMPFVTEALWENLQPGKLLMVQPWPKDTTPKTSVEKKWLAIQDTVAGLRNFRVYGRLTGDVAGDFSADLPAELVSVLSKVTTRRVPRLVVKDDHGAVQLGGVKFCFPKEYVDRYRGWVEQERRSLIDFIAGLEKKVNDPGFISRAPAELVATEKQKLAIARTRLETL